MISQMRIILTNLVGEKDLILLQNGKKLKASKNSQP